MVFYSVSEGHGLKMNQLDITWVENGGLKLIWNPGIFFNLHCARNKNAQQLVKDETLSVKSYTFQGSKLPPVRNWNVLLDFGDIKKGILVISILYSLGQF